MYFYVLGLNKTAVPGLLKSLFTASEICNIIISCMKICFVHI